MATMEIDPATISDVLRRVAKEAALGPQLTESADIDREQTRAFADRLDTEGEPRVGDLVKVRDTVPIFSGSEAIVVEIEGARLCVAYGRESVWCDASDVSISARSGYKVEEHGQ